MDCDCICHKKHFKGFHCQDCFRKHNTCGLCNSNEDITKHHLIPQAIGNGSGGLVKLCRKCHDIVHQTFSHSQLAEKYNTLDELASSHVLMAHLRNSGIRSASENLIDLPASGNVS